MVAAKRPRRAPAPSLESATPTPAEAAPEAGAVAPNLRRGYLTEHDVYLFKEGSHGRLAHKLGAHLATENGVAGARFALWAPNARAVSVVGDFNDWHGPHAELQPRPDSSGIWEGFLPGVTRGAHYKYRIHSHAGGEPFDKGDPYALYWEAPPRTASSVWSFDYAWGDGEWMQHRQRANRLDAPWSIYEVHLGSWRRVPEDNNRPLTYRELAVQLPEYVRDLGFTHVELLPVAEHPFYGSWGYQCTGYFAPTARYGEPEDFMLLVDALHQAGIGVILDWVPSHFPDDPHGLANFDGTALFEHADPRQGYHPEWHSVLFNYGRHEVRAFLLSSALFWLENYHIDALRVDAVASMLYLDYGRKPDEWIPNRHGGKENLEAIQFLHQLNQGVYRDHADTQTIAEESTAWPMVSRPVDAGGLGFGMKWNMGWMHDTLRYFSADPIYRRHHHDELTFSLVYAFHENFVLPLSHDEVVYGKGSLIAKMPGDNWQRFANLRLLYGYMWTHPGKKLLFMGGEFAQWTEWQHETSLDWHLLKYPDHVGMRRWLADLNAFYREHPALYEEDFSPAGFEWVESGDRDNSVLCYLRRGHDPSQQVLAVCNFTPVPRHDYRVGIPRGGHWREVLNSDAHIYGGSGMGNGGGADAIQGSWHGRDQFLNLTLPPLAAVIFEPS